MFLDKTLLERQNRRRTVAGSRPHLRLALVVDDDADNRELCSQVLALSGFRVVEALNGREALLRAESCRPDIVILDLWMPGMDGWEVMRRLRSHPLTSDIPVLVVSARVTSDEPERALAAGCDGFIGKPYSPDALTLEATRVMGERFAGPVQDECGWR
jgi:two-component system, cell cycle response regulator DivK